MTKPLPLSAVLAATDLSAPSRHALERAARIARAGGASLTVLHVLPATALDELRQWLGAGGAPEQALIDQARRQLHEMAEAIGRAHGLAADECVTSGTVLDEIAAAAERLDAGLLVVGARGQGFMRRLVLGSTAERLLRRARRPVLIARNGAHHAYRRVLVPVDFSPWSAPTVELARRIAPRAHFVLLHAWAVPFEEKLRFAGVDESTVEHYRRKARSEAEQRLHALASAQGLSADAWTACLVQGDASLRVVEQEQEQDVDLIAIGKHGRHVAEDLLLGSVTKHVLAEAQADVLVATAP